MLGVSVHPFSHKLEWRGINPTIAPALRATDHKCPHCFFMITDGKTDTRKPTPPKLRYALGRTNANGKGQGYNTLSFHANPYFGCVTARRFTNETSSITTTSRIL